MPDVLPIVIKKPYAASLLAHLQKEGAIDIIEENLDIIPEWQKEFVRKSIVNIKQHPEQLQDWDTAKQKYERP